MSLSGYPYNDIVLIESYLSPTQLALATGFAIGPHTILTAAHVVRDPAASPGVTRAAYSLFPGYSGAPTASYPAWGSAGSVTISNAAVHYDSNWSMNSDGSEDKSQAQYDFTIIDTSAITFSNWFDITAVGSNFTSGSRNISGYPYGGTYNGGYQYTNYNVSVTANSAYGVFDYASGSTYHGMSGGPIWSQSLDSNNRYVADGLVAAGGSGGDIGVRFTSKDLAEIHRWMALDGYGYARPSDFNGDGKSDILWRNANGAIALWSAGDHNSYVGLGGVGPEWQIAGQGDFNGDGKSDILWKNTNGAVALWSAGNNNSYVALGGVGPEWQIAGVGDFNGDGKSDILWKNINGAVALWNSGNNNSYVALGGVGPEWQIAGVGDFNGDGNSDILWRNSSGAIALWNSGNNNSYVALGGVGPEWQIAGVGDFNGDGKSDILWRNSNGAIALWNSGDSNSYVSLGGVGPEWQIAGVGDFNGDSRSDILWKNTNGAVALWSGGNNNSYVDLGGVGSDWKIVA